MIRPPALLGLQLTPELRSRTTQPTRVGRDDRDGPDCAAQLPGETYAGVFNGHTRRKVYLRSMFEQDMVGEGIDQTARYQI